MKPHELDLIHSHDVIVAATHPFPGGGALPSEVRSAAGAQGLADRRSHHTNS